MVNGVEDLQTVSRIALAYNSSVGSSSRNGYDVSTDPLHPTSFFDQQAKA